MEVHTWASTFASWWWIFSGGSGIPQVSIEVGGGAEFGDPTSCENHVDNLVSIAKAGFVTRGLLETGRDLLKIAWAFAQLNDGGRNLPTDGFISHLVDGGQKGHVYRHIYAHAGAIIIGENLVVPTGAAIGRINANETGNALSMRELRVDIAQLQDPDHEAEATSEINGSNAGRRIGELLRDGMLKGANANWDEIRSAVYKHMCE